MNKRQLIVLGIAALIILVLAAWPTHLLHPELSNLWRHRLIGLVVVLAAIQIFALKDPKPSEDATEDDPGQHHPNAWGCGTMGLIPVALFGLFWLFTYPIAFDSADWRTPCRGYRRDTGARARMIDDLMENHLRVGMTHAEVEGILGCPNAGSRSPWVWKVWSKCDPPPGGSADRPKYLYVSFDEAGLVLKSWIDY